MDEEATIQEPGDVRERAIEFADVSGGYRRATVFRDMSFAIREGSMAALIGPNGSGKTSMLRAATGLLPRVTGQVRLFGLQVDWQAGFAHRFGGDRTDAAGDRTAGPFSKLQRPGLGHERPDGGRTGKKDGVRPFLSKISGTRMIRQVRFFRPIDRKTIHDGPGLMQSIKEDIPTEISGDQDDL